MRISVARIADIISGAPGGMYLVFIFLLSCIWASVVSFYVEDVSLDFQPIVDVIGVFRSVEGGGERLLWAFGGNILALFFLDSLFPWLSPLGLAKLLYFSASFLRCFVLFLLFRPLAALSLLFAFIWAFDLNQARLSISFSFYLLFLAMAERRYSILAMMMHNLVWPLALYRIVPIRLRLVGLVSGLTLICVIVPLVFPRYLVVFEGHEVPKNILLYVLFSMVTLFFFLNRRVRPPDVEVCLGLFVVLVYLVSLGMSPVYLGRIGELLFHISIVYVFLYAGNRGYKQLVVGRSMQVESLLSCFFCWVVGLYQLLTINGNIWRFF